MSDRIENGNTSVLEIFRNLTYGELSQYPIGGAKTGKIAETDYPHVMSAINRGVNEIQKDLSINENSVRLRLIPGIVTYPIHSRHSITNGVETPENRLFVDDSPYDLFEDDIFRIHQVYNKGGRELTINNRNRSDTIYIPQHNVIQVPFVKAGDILGVVYTRMTRPIIVTTEIEASTSFLPLGDYTLNALYAYVASIMTAGISTEQELSESQMWMSVYEARIAKIKNTPAVPTDSYENTKLTDNGFI